MFISKETLNVPRCKTLKKCLKVLNKLKSNGYPAYKKNLYLISPVYHQIIKLITLFKFQGLLPRGEKPNKLRDKNMEVNIALKRMVPTVPNTTFLNADPGFVTPIGQIRPSDMHDYLHLTRHANGKVCNIIHNHITKTFGIL